MSQQNQTAPLAGSRALSAVLVIPALLIIADFIVAGVTAKYGNMMIPIELVAGFTYRVLPLAPVAEAIVIAIGLWWYCRLGIVSTVIAAVLMFVLRIAAAFLFGYTMSVVTPLLSDAVVSSSTSFYGPLFLQTALTGAAVLIILAIYEQQFRSWLAWLYILVIWAGGTTLLFVLYHDQILGLTYYPLLAQIVRVLGFIVIGHRFALAASRGR